MLIPFDMIAVMLYIGYYAGQPVAAPPPLAAAAAALAAGCLLLSGGAALLNRLSVRRLRHGRSDAMSRRRLAGRADALIRVALVAFYIAFLEETAFPWSVAAALGWRAGPDSMAAQLLALLPYLLFFFAAWLPMLGLHRETNFGRWTRRSFLVHKARYNLFMLLAWIPFAVMADWLSEAAAALPFLFLAAAWTFPWVLARIWGCQPLAEGETLDAVRRMEKLAGARFSSVYMWNPGSGVQNAAAVGIFRPFRYLFLTPALVEGMTREELEGVILHELGHVRNRHLLFYLFTTLGGLNLAVLIGAVAPMTGTTERFVLTAALVLAYFRLAFGWLSRNMERQADLFSLEKSGSPAALANALEKLGLSAGNIRRAASWHHLGIAERVDMLRRADRCPELIRAHNAAVRRIMAFGYAFSVAILAAVGGLVAAEMGAAAPPPSAALPPAAEQAEAHWRRVMRIMPGNATAPLELAYQLAANPASLDEAEAMAARARELACGVEEKAAASKLAEELSGQPGR